MSPPFRTTLYRNYLLVTVSLLIVTGISGRRSALLFLAGAWAIQIAVAALLTRRGRASIAVRRTFKPGAFEWDSVPVTLEISSVDRSVGDVEIADRFGPAMSDAQRVIVSGPIRPGTRREAIYEGFCARRWGMHTVGPLRATVSDALGLFHLTRAFPLVADFPVFPQVHEVVGLPRDGAHASLASQDESVARSGQSLQFLGAREYRSGDDLRRIHWPATARMGRPIVKELELDLQPVFTLLLDLHQKNRAGTGVRSCLELLVRSAASILWSAIQRGDSVQLIAEGRRTLFVPPGRGAAHLALLLEQLIRAREEGPHALLEVFEAYRSAVAPGSTLCCLVGTAVLEPEDVAGLVEFCDARHVRLVLVLVDSWTLTPWETWPLPAEKKTARVAALTAFLRAHGVPFRLLDGAVDLESELSRPDFFESEEL